LVGNLFVIHGKVKQRGTFTNGGIGIAEADVHGILACSKLCCIDADVSLGFLPAGARTVVRAVISVLRKRTYIFCVPSGNSALEMATYASPCFQPARVSWKAL
jgi:hypothetical protein